MTRARTGSRTATAPALEQPAQPAGTVDVGTYRPASPARSARARARGSATPPAPADGTGEPASPARDARTRPATPAELRAADRAQRSQLNKLAHAARQAATEYRRTARQIGPDSAYYAGLIASAEQQDALADAWEAQRPAVPTIAERRQAGRAPRTLTADERALLEAGGIDVDRMLEAAAYARADRAAYRARRRR